MSLKSKIIILSALLLLIGCSDDDEPKLDRIVILSSQGFRLDIILEQQTSLIVKGLDRKGDTVEISSAIDWTVDANNISIDENGLVTPTDIGTVSVTATVKNLTASTLIDVWDSSAPRIEIYVSDVGLDRNGPHQIVKYDETGVFPENFITSRVSRPQDIIFLEDQGIILVSNLGSNNINKFNINSGEWIGAFATELAAPTRIDIGPDGLLYVAPWNGGPVKRFTIEGDFVDDFTETDINQAIGLAWDAQGNLYVSSFNNGANGFVRKFDATGSDLGVFVGSNLAGPTDIWFDKAGNLLVNDWSGNSVKKYDRNGAFSSTFISNVSQPEGVALLDDGSILIGASGSSAIKMYDENGTFIKDLVAAGTGRLVTPNAVVIRKVNF